MSARRVRQGAPFGVVAVLAVLSGIGCGGGGGGGGGGPTQPPPPQSAVTFTADANAGAESIYLGTGQGSGGATWVMEVRAQGVVDLYGVSLVVEFPTNLLDFVRGSESEGTFLSESGEFDTELIVDERQAGEVVIGISRIGVEPGVDGSGALLSVRFNAIGSGTGPISIAEGGAVDSLGVVQEDVDFIGGSVNVRIN